MDGLDSEDRGRGTAIYIHQSLQYIRIDLTRVIQSQAGTASVPVDFIACEIKLTEGDKLLLCNIYRSPNNSKVNNQLLNDTMRKLSDTGHYKQILIVGDFNHPGISWEDGIANGEDDYNFLETVRDCFLTQHVSTPTRGRGAQIPSVLDIVLTSVESILTTRIKCIVSEVFKSLYKLNAPCLHDMFKINKTSYDVRVTKLEQPLRRTTNYGLRTFSYIGSRLWNLLVQEYPEVPHMDLGQFKSLLKHWTGPKCDVTEMHIL